MKTINQYIIEKFKINSKNISKSYKFKSHITDNPYEFNGVNFIIGSADFKKSRIAILIEYANKIIKDDLLESNEDIDFVKNWIKRAKEAYKYESSKEFEELCNGERPYFCNAKFTYDLIQYGLNDPNITIPRKQKLEKMIREYWYNVEKHKDEMNWY